MPEQPRYLLDLPSASVANPAEVGPGTTSPSQTSQFFPPDSAVIEVRGGASAGVTDVNGERVVYYPTPFPNATIASPCANASIAGTDLITIMARWNYGFRYRLSNAATKTPRNNVVSSVEYIATGY